MRRFFRRALAVPSYLAARISAYMHQRYWTSPKVQTPSSVTLEEIQFFLEKSGIQPGDTVMLHSSWEALNSGGFTAAELIKMLVNYLGEQGTLAMPAFPDYKNQVEGAVFNVKRTPSAGGMLTEIFRRYPHVLRSINLNHSVCALGANAEYLTSEHNKSKTSWDEYSPYYRLRNLDNAWVVGFGVGHRLKIATAVHCVESALHEENAYFKKLFKNRLCYTYKDAAGETGKHCYKKRTGQIYTPKLAKYFSEDELIEDTKSGLELYAISARTLIDRSIELGRKGKTMYVWPIPWPWLFKKK